MNSTTPRLQPDSLAVLGVLMALGLAAMAQYASSVDGISALVLVGYAVAGALFAVTGSRAVEETTPPQPHAAGRRLALAAAGSAVAVVLGVAAHTVVYDSL